MRSEAAPVSPAPAISHQRHRAVIEPADGFEQLLGAAVHYRIATGLHAGRKALTLRTVASNPPASNPCCTDIEPDNDHADTPATMPIGGLFFLFVDYPHFSTERVSGANGLSGVSALPSFAHPASRQWSLSRGRTTWLTRPMAMSSTPRNQPWIAIRCIR